MAFWRFTAALSDDLRETLDLIPGVKLNPTGAAAPRNAAWIVESILGALGVPFRVSAPRGAKPHGAALALPWLQPWVPGFLTSYQRDGISNVLAIPGESGHLHWSAGCLSGDTELVVNRGGAAKPITLRDLVHKFNGGYKSNRRQGGGPGRWDTSIPTHTQSIVDGYVRLNKIERAYSNGIAEVFEVITAGGRRIRATKAHEFQRADGTFTGLENLTHGCVVLVAEWLKSAGKAKAENHGKEDGWKHVSGRAVPDTIVSILSVGEEEVFDLGMTAPFHNYIANEFIVHNSGKTLGGLVWALAVGPSITVVVTKAAIRGTWTREIDTYTKGCEWRVLEGMKAGVIGAIPTDRPLILVTGYDTLPAWIATLEGLRPRSIVLDEIHHVRSSKRWDAEVDLGGGEIQKTTETQPPCDLAAPIPAPAVTFSLKDNRAAAAYRLSRSTRRRLGLTATPISDRVRDLWAQLDLIHPWEFGGFYQFARRYCAATENSFGGMDTRGKSNLEELQRRLTFVSHRVPFSIANRDLPAKRRLVTYVKVSEQCKAEGFTEDLKKTMRGVTSGAEGRARLTEMLLMEAAARKRKIVEAWVSDAISAGQKVIVFTGRRKDCARMAEEITKAANALLVQKRIAKPVPVFTGDGSTPMGSGRDPTPGTREWMKDRYMEAEGAAVLVGTGDAWGEGLNLQNTDLMILAMLPYTPRQIIQWEGRVARLGQKRPVLIRYPICEGTIDERVCTILLNKLPAVEKATASDEITGLGQELMGASEEELIGSLLDKVLGEAK